MASRIVAVLVVLALMVQARLIYKQHRGTDGPVRDAPSGSTLDLSGTPFKGSNSSKLVLVEFSDYECPYCARHAMGVGAELDREFIASGKIRLAFVNNPLPIHRNAEFLATAAICAGRQNQYWEMHDALFAQRPRTREAVLTLVEDLPLNVGKFQDCINGDPLTAKEIARDKQRARALALTGTPAFALGRIDAQGELKIDKFLLGIQPIDVFEKAIRDVLSKANAS